MGLFTRGIRPDADPRGVGSDAVPGDPNGVVVDPTEPAFSPPAPPRVLVQPWSGWPADWSTPAWNGHYQRLLDTVWLCQDINTGILSTMPPYLTGSAPSLDAEWLRNPDPDVYASWEEFARVLWWDFCLGEAFLLATARYATGLPARFHVVPPWMVNAEMRDGFRVYSIGDRDVTSDIMHLRYTSQAGDAHGHGPLEAGATRLLAAETLARYAAGIASSGGVPPSILTHPDELDAAQSAELKAQWIQARLSNLGEPAVLSGGVTWTPTTVNPTEMALIDLLQFNESRIALMMGVPPHLIGLPSGGDAMTYSNTTSLYEFHWRAMLAPRATRVCADLSGWLLPRGTGLALNHDSYTAPDPQVRATIEATYNQIQDTLGNPVLSVEEIRKIEHFDEPMKLEGAPR